MRTLLVLGFPYPTTANAAAQDILLQEPDLAGSPDAVAVVTCDDDGAFQVTTNHTHAEGHPFFWHLLLTALVFLPASGTLSEQELADLSERLQALGLGASFQHRMREMLAPNTSALLLLATRPVPADALTALGRFGGKLLAASLIPDIDAQLTHALVGAREFAAILDAAKGADAGTGPQRASLPPPEGRVVPRSRVSPGPGEPPGGRRGPDRR